MSTGAPETATGQLDPGRLDPGRPDRGRADPGRATPGPAAPSGTDTGSRPDRPDRASGFCRVTVVAPDSRIDVALPEDVPVADLYPEILRLSRQSPAEGAPVGHHLVRRDGSVLDSARTLAAERVLDGELLALRPFSDSLPPAVIDDVSEAVAAAVSRDHTLWNGDLTRTGGLVAGGVLPALLAFVAWTSRPGHDMHGLPGVLAAVTGLVLTTAACVRARVHDDRAGALALGLGALPSVGVAGSGLLPPAEGAGVGTLQFLSACAAVLLAALALTLCSPRGDGPFVACVLAAGIGVATVFTALLARWDATGTAALCAPLAVGALAFLPGVSLRFARLPLGFDPPRTGAYAGPETEPLHEPVDRHRVEERVRRGHELLVGLVGGCALVATVACAVLGFSDDLWARLLALATGIALLTRATLFRYTAQVGPLLAAGLASLVLLGLGLALNPPAAADPAERELLTLWLTAAVAAGTALTTGIGLAAPRGGRSPFWGRFLEIAEGFVLLTLIPLALAVLGVYEAARAMTG